jgi:hypothetical protein
MAAATSSNVRLITAWTEGSLTSKRRQCRRVEIVGGSFGGASNTIPASAFGLTVVEEVSPANYFDKVYLATPNSAGDTVYLYAAVNASAADLTVGATPNGAYLTVKGY